MNEGGGTAATTAAGSGPEGTRHSADAAILFLQLQPTQNAPSPREPLLHGAEHSGKGISSALSVGWDAGEREEPDPRESQPTLQASPSHAQPRLRTKVPADCAGLVLPVQFPAPAHFHFRSSSAPLLLPVSHLSPGGLCVESALGSRRIIFLSQMWPMKASGLLGS